jgi:hypothetical protein
LTLCTQNSSQHLRICIGVHSMDHTDRRKGHSCKLFLHPINDWSLESIEASCSGKLRFLKIFQKFSSSRQSTMTNCMSPLNEVPTAVNPVVEFL